nr:RNA-directed DNA polymerase, eukaryota, reverse transcriptase zinc-binding domain protein [Tanacetum cinerariifolium]
MFWRYRLRHMTYEKLWIEEVRVEVYCGEDNQVPIQFVNHFMKFLITWDDNECLELDSKLFLNKISNLEASRMIEEVTNDEIKNAMFSIDDNKAPGPNGFTAKFFKRAWHVIGMDVCNAVKELFAKGKLHEELNATLITLVPKESSFQEGECDGPPEPEWEGTISSFDEAIILPSITPVVKKARKALAKKNARDEEKPTLINILARHCAPMAPAICASAAPLGCLDFTLKLSTGLWHVSLLHHILFALMEIYMKIGVKDCKCLIDKVKTRIYDWKNKSMTYAGRAQLIVSLLASIQVYWASVLKFPKAVIKDIERAFKGVLWNQSEIQKGKAKISWKEVF